MDANSRSLTAKKVGEAAAAGAAHDAVQDPNSPAAVATSNETIVEEDGCETPKQPFAPATVGVNHLDNGHRLDTGYASSSTSLTRGGPGDTPAGAAKRLEILRVTQALLDSVATGDYTQYS